jgi:hypothetical protein
MAQTSLSRHTRCTGGAGRKTAPTTGSPCLFVFRVLKIPITISGSESN